MELSALKLPTGRRESLIKNEMRCSRFDSALDRAGLDRDAIAAAFAEYEQANKRRLKKVDSMTAREFYVALALIMNDGDLEGGASELASLLGAEFLAGEDLRKLPETESIFMGSIVSGAEVARQRDMADALRIFQSVGAQRGLTEGQVRALAEANKVSVLDFDDLEVDGRAYEGNAFRVLAAEDVPSGVAFQGGECGFELRDAVSVTTVFVFDDGTNYQTHKGMMELNQPELTVNRGFVIASQLNEIPITGDHDFTVQQGEGGAKVVEWDVVYD